MKHLFLMFLINLCFEGRGQRDSIEILDSLIEETLYNDPILSLGYSNKFMRIGKTRQDSSLIIRGAKNIGSSNLILGNLDLALLNFKYALPIANRLNLRKEIADINNNIGVTYQYLDAYEKAAEYYLTALSIEEELQDTLSFASSYGNLAIVNRELKNYQLSKEYYDKSLKIFRHLGDSINIAHSLANYAALMSDLKLDHLAEEYLDEALAFITKEENPFLYASIIQNIAVSQLIEKEYSEALRTYYVLEGIAVNLGTQDHYIDAKIGLGASYLGLKKYFKAYEALNEALYFSKQEELLFFEKESYLGISSYFQSLEQYDSAFFYFTQASTLTDSLYSSESSDRIAKLQTIYEVDKTTEQLKVAEKEKSDQAQVITRQRKQIGLGILISVLLGVIVFLLNRQSKQRKQTAATLSEKNQAIESANERLEVKNREIKHRTRDNFLKVIGLLELQKLLNVNSDSKGLTEDMSKRVYAISTLNSLLDSTPTEIGVNAKEYFDLICDNHLKTANLEYPNSLIERSIDSVKLDGQYASDIGLILNELITNSFKYAFKNRVNPKINIAFDNSKSEIITLFYEDNGNVPFDLSSGESSGRTGLLLVQRLTTLLKGEITQSFHENPVFTFTFPKENLIKK